MYSSPREQKIQPIGLVGRREAISAPTVGYASDSTPVSTAIVGPSLGPSVTMRSVRKSSQRASAMSTTHTAQSDHANHAAVRLLIPPTPRPCFLVPFVTTITLPPSPSSRHSDNRYRCLRWSANRIDVGEYRGLHPLADKAQSTSTTIALLLCIRLHPEPLCAHTSATILG